MISYEKIIGILKLCVNRKVTPRIHCIGDVIITSHLKMQIAFKDKA